MCKQIIATNKYNPYKGVSETEVTTIYGGRRVKNDIGLGNQYSHLKSDIGVTYVASRELAVDYHALALAITPMPQQLFTTYEYMVREIDVMDKEVHIECFCTPQRCHCTSHANRATAMCNNSKLSTHALKDMRKFSICTHILGIGLLGSSSHKHNTTGDIHGVKLSTALNSLTPASLVGVSVNGARGNRIKLQQHHIQKIIDAKCLIVADDSYNKNRSYNIGERELESILVRLKYRTTEADGRMVYFPPNWVSPL